MQEKLITLSEDVGMGIFIRVTSLIKFRAWLLWLIFGYYVFYGLCISYHSTFNVFFPIINVQRVDTQSIMHNFVKKQYRTNCWCHFKAKNVVFKIMQTIHILEMLTCEPF